MEEREQVPHLSSEERMPPKMVWTTQEQCGHRPEGVFQTTGSGACWAEWVWIPSRTEMRSSCASCCSYPARRLECAQTEWRKVAGEMGRADPERVSE